VPDDGPAALARPHRTGRRTPAVGGITRDTVDVRDRLYEPTLRALPARLDPPEELLAKLRDPAVAWPLPREQGTEGTCGGHALAALVDLERLRCTPDRAKAVSARMIHTMARRTDEGGARGGVSLRDVIKGFYNHGVCSEESWAYKPGNPNGYLNVERAKEAREVSLGAYYRLRPNLNTYHSALHEAGAVIVSAELHDGWLHEAVRRNHGSIVPPGRGQPRGTLAAECHAFVIVGYTEKGFLVLNSWGRGWGGWNVGETPCPGLGLWHYADWADTVMDGWVLRLGVGSAEAFEFSVGDQGLGFGPEPTVRATPVHAILGHYLHLDDGDYVGHGAFVSTQVTLDETRRLLIADRDTDPGTDGRDPYQGVLLTFAGALLGLKDAAAQIARLKPMVRDAGWYPFTVLWCVDYVEQARAVLEGVFSEARAQVARPGPDLDRLIEQRAHGVGRALWRDIGRAADRAAAAGQPFHDLTRAAVALHEARPDFGIRVLAESEGAYALIALLTQLLDQGRDDERAAIYAMIRSVDLVAPPIGHDRFEDLAALLDAGWGASRPDRRIRVHLPSEADEARLAVPPYGRSYFELVARAFTHRADRDPPPKPAGKGRPDRVAPAWTAWAGTPRTDLVPIGWPARGAPPSAAGPINQIELIYRSDVEGRLRAILAPPGR